VRIIVPTTNDGDSIVQIRGEQESVDQALRAILELIANPPRVCRSLDS